MKQLLLIALLTCAVYMQCNESNWQEYYNSDGQLYDDTSFNEGVSSGDVNLDSNVNVVDIVTLVSILLYNE